MEYYLFFLYIHTARSPSNDDVTTIVPDTNEAPLVPFVDAATFPTANAGRNSTKPNNVPKMLITFCLGFGKKTLKLV